MSKYTDTYRQEAEDHLANIEETILDIEQNPDDQESLNRLFRAMHTIKGSGAMFGFDDIAGFAHHVENVLDKVRRGSVPISRELIDLILASRDQIKVMLDASDGGAEVDIELSGKIISALENLLPDKDEPDDGFDDDFPPDDDPNVREKTYRIRFRPGADIFASGTDPALLLAELRELGECNALAHMHNVPILEEIAPEKCYVHWHIILTTSSSDFNAIRGVFIFVEDSSDVRIDIVDDFDDEASEESGAIIKKIGEILMERGDVSSAALMNALNSQKRLGEILVETNAADRDAVDSALVEQQHIREVSKRRRQMASVSSIRVAADKLDNLINLVGELVITQARLSQVASALDHIELGSPVEEVERLTVELRDCALNMRMVPIGTSFGKFRRLVRDLSLELGKDITLVTEGGETELDKTVIERLNDPLVHLIRNSVDHGIHTPENREGHGKPRQGVISLSAAHRGAKVAITIKDDGMGIDPDAVWAKAMEKGLVSKENMLSQEEIFALLFTPGFSTAKRVTDVSGRGVGLDVVKREIDSLGGTIQITSEKGKGTAIVLAMPLTLAIIDGLLVDVGGHNYVLPLALIEECAELTDAHMEKTHGRNMIPVRGKVVPFVRLRDLFAILGEKPEIEHIIIVEADNFRVGIVVDEIIGNLQTVIKPLDRAYRNAEGISGATIMGDGTVGLIVDIPELIRCARRDEKN